MKNDKKIILLSDLIVDEKAQIVSVDCENITLKRRLFEMGLIKGVIVKLKKKAPFGDPLSIELRGYELCVRGEDMQFVKVKRV